MKNEVRFCGHEKLAKSQLNLPHGCNDPRIVCNLQVSAPFSNSDHSMVYFNLILSSHEVSTDVKRIYDFEHCDTNAISQALFAHPFNNTEQSVLLTKYGTSSWSL